VRWIIVILARVITSMMLLDARHQVPADIQLLHNPQFQERTWKLLASLGSWLTRSIQNSIDTLTLTFPERSNAWKKGIIAEHRRLKRLGSAVHLDRHTPEPTTCGIPNEPSEIHACVQRLIQDNQVSDNSSLHDGGFEETVSEAPSNHPSARRTSGFTKRRDASVEEISLTDISGTSSGDEIDPASLSSGGDEPTSGQAFHQSFSAAVEAYLSESDSESESLGQPFTRMVAANSESATEPNDAEALPSPLDRRSTHGMYSAVVWVCSCYQCWSDRDNRK
jgi:hypothetical protein